MKNLLFAISLLILSQLNLIAQEQSAYFQVGTSTESMVDAMNTVKTALQNSGFNVIGEYNPADSENLAVVCYTRPDLEKNRTRFRRPWSVGSNFKNRIQKRGQLCKNKHVKSDVSFLWVFY